MVDKNKELREKVYNMCDSLGFWNVRPQIVAKELNTSHTNIIRWKKQWIDKNGIPRVKEYGMEMNVNSLTALKELGKLAKDEDKKIRLEAIKALFDTQEKYTKFLEAFGYKDLVTPTTETHISLSWGKPDEDKK